MRKVGTEKGKKVQYMNNTFINPKQNIRRGKVIAKLCSIVKVPHIHTDTPAPSCGVKDEQTERGSRRPKQRTVFLFYHMC
jgi:hypothetical protein